MIRVDFYNDVVKHQHLSNKMFPFPFIDRQTQLHQLMYVVISYYFTKTLRNLTIM